MSTFVFDVDDTLLATNWTYDKSYAKFFHYLHEILPARMPSLHDVYERLYELEAELAPEWGVRRGRVAESMARLYREICEWSGSLHGERLYRKECEAEIRLIGDRPFNYTRHCWLPGARETLTELKGAGHTLCLLTSYDSRLFPDKAKYLGFEQWFDVERMCYIDGKKTAGDFISASGWTESADGLFYAVGNGESDIMPALSIAENWRGIYIPRRSTSPFFKRDGRKVSFDAAHLEHPRIVNLMKFSEIPEYI